MPGAHDIANENLPRLTIDNSTVKYMSHALYFFEKFYNYFILFLISINITIYRLRSSELMRINIMIGSESTTAQSASSESTA